MALELISKNDQPSSSIDDIKQKFKDRNATADWNPFTYERILKTIDDIFPYMETLTQGRKEDFFKMSPPNDVQALAIDLFNNQKVDVKELAGIFIPNYGRSAKSVCKYYDLLWAMNRPAMKKGKTGLFTMDAARILSVVFDPAHPGKIQKLTQGTHVETIVLQPNSAYIPLYIDTKKGDSDAS